MSDTTPTIGTRFTTTVESAWSGPCKTCGHANARHYVKVDGRRRLVECMNHARQSGIERADLVCEITDVTDGQISHRVVEQSNVRNPLPGTSGQKHTTGGLTVDWWNEQTASGAIVVLAHDYSAHYASDAERRRADRAEHRARNGRRR